ncbi:MAG: type 1 glutamine amidotransferase, partial [Candidatus Nitrosopumilus limneticus]|nr:type 1 glutamine amidotransferase [Candidatus Nitrosopumilus limneticus]
KHETIPTKEFSLIVILGAPESANDDLPYLIAEQKLIKNSVNSNIPVLGICLGSQLIAKTFGAKVYQGPKKEIGFYHDLMFSNNSKLFEGFKNPFSVFHWHGDTFDLPIGATRLVLSANYQNQAFRYKSAVGLQFHLEINEQMVNLWLDKTEEKLKQITYIDPQKIRSDINENISIVKSNMELFYNNFKCEFGL